MKYYVAFDGGGSKLAAILFDENLVPISSAVGGSMNTHSTDPDHARKNAAACCRELIEGTGVTEIECVYGVFYRFVSEELGKIVKVNRLDDQGGEGLLSLLAALVFGDSVTALSGTGSVVFYNCKDGPGGEAGGFGSIIHDEGSGYYMGRLAFAEAIKDYEKRGPHTLITDCICKKLGVPDIGEAGHAVRNHPTKSPAAAVASVAPCVGEAARMGDEVAPKLLWKCARKMADQTIGLIRRLNVPKNVPIVLSGGHWKNDASMAEYFTQMVNEEDPGREVVSPYFEPIVGAVLVHLYAQGITPDEAEIERIKGLYKDFKYKVNG